MNLEMSLGSLTLGIIQALESCGVYSKFYSFVVFSAINTDSEFYIMAKRNLMCFKKVCKNCLSYEINFMNYLSTSQEMNLQNMDNMWV